jgi:hypothetical protein
MSSTKKDNIPHDSQTRKRMIEDFVRDNKENPEKYVVHEAVPYEQDNTSRPTGRRGKRPSE